MVIYKHGRLVKHTTLCWRNENLIPLKLSFCSRDKSRGTLPSIC
nr:MAG TPA: hypothetical protein [Caudoviricetes sp.]